MMTSTVKEEIVSPPAVLPVTQVKLPPELALMQLPAPRPEASVITTLFAVARLVPLSVTLLQVSVPALASTRKVSAPRPLSQDFCYNV